MAASEPTTELTPLEYLAHADREWADGNHQEAAALLWKATKSTFIHLAEEHGLEVDEYMIGLAKALESGSAVSEGYYRGNLITGKLLRDHASLELLESCELEDAYSGARDFVIKQIGEHE